MDTEFEKEQFKSISIKVSVVRKFRIFCNKMSKSQSMTLLIMLDFFEDNSISPFAKLGANMNTLESRINKRINASIAILKNIENSQTKPTNAMLELLFQQNVEDEQEEDDFFEFEPQELMSENEELNYYRNQYDTIKTNYYLLKNEFEMLIQNTKYIRNNFGVAQYKLNITTKEFESLKQKLEHVYHHNSTEING